MLKWNDIIRFANKGTPAPDRRVEKNTRRMGRIINHPLART